MLFEVEIEKMVPPGNGLGYFEGKAVFIEGTIVGDVVKAYKVKEKKKFIVAVVKEIVKPSPQRVEAVCPHYQTCGGCSLMHLSLEDQIELKKEMLNDTLSSFDILPADKIKLSHTALGYRYKTRLKVKNGVVGFQKRFSNDLVGIESCPVLSEGLNRSLNTLKTLNLSDGVLHLQESSATGEISGVKSNNKFIESIPGFKFEIEEDYGAGLTTLQGGQFSQANPAITKDIIEDLLAEVKEEDDVCELYCGSGTFSMAVGARSAQLTGYELSEIAIQQAKQNARKNKLKNVDFKVANLDKAEMDRDINLIIADPPRAGLSPKVIRQITNSKAQRFLYVSCNPATMARDCRKLKEEGGFSVKKVTGYDMYPQTTHLEALAVLER